MAKQSQIEKALANLRAERDVLDLAIRKLEAQQVTNAPKRSAQLPKRSRKRDQGEGATTDSGNMKYPPA